MNDNSGSSLNDLVLRQRTYSSNKGIRYGVEPQTIYIDVVILAYNIRCTLLRFNPDLAECSNGESNKKSTN